MIGAVQAAKYGGAGLAALIALVGLLYVGGVIGVPEAGLQDNEWGEVDDERIEVVTTVWIDNPNPFGASADRVDYDLAMNDVDLASGRADDVSIPSGNDTVTLRTDLDYEQLPAWWASHVRNGEVSDVRVDALVHLSVAGQSTSRSVSHEDAVETDVERMLGEALSELEGEYSGTEGDVTVAGQAVQPRAEIRDTQVQWGEVTEERTDVDVTLTVHNPNPYPIPTPGFAGEFTMNDVEVLEWDANQVDVVEQPEDGLIPPRSTAAVDLRLALDNQRFAEWFATHVDAQERTDAAMSVQLALEVAGSELRIPPDGEAMRCEYDLRTAIFVEQAQGLERRSCQFATVDSAASLLEESANVLAAENVDQWGAGDAGDGDWAASDDGGDGSEGDGSDTGDGDDGTGGADGNDGTDGADGSDRTDGADGSDGSGDLADDALTGALLG